MARYFYIVIPLLFIYFTIPGGVWGQVTADQIPVVKLEADAMGVVYDVYQDEIGLLWIATDKGLLWYDGNGVTSPGTIDPDAAWLDHLTIHSLQEDQMGRLWIMYQGGVVRWNPHTRSFHRVQQLAGMKVNTMIQEGKDQYWVGADDGLYFFNEGALDDEALEYITSDPHGGGITSLFKDQDAFLWIGMTHGLRVLDVITRNVLDITSEGDVLPILRIAFIIQDEDGKIWVGSKNEGMIAVLSHVTEDRQIRVEAERLSEFPSTHLISALKKRNGDLLIGTSDKQVLRWNPVQEEEALGSMLQLTLEQMASPLTRDVNAMFEDKTGLIWFGTANGLYKSAIRPSLPLDPALRDSLHAHEFKYIRALVKDRHNTLWMGSFGNGLIRFDRETGELVHYKKMSRLDNSLVDDRVLSIDIDRSERVWILTSGGVSKYDPRTDTFRTYLAAADGPITAEYIIFQDIFVSTSNDIWVTTSYDGVLKYNAARDMFEAWPMAFDQSENQSLVEIRQVVQDRMDTFWFALGKDGLLGYEKDASGAPGRDQIIDMPEALIGKEVVSLAPAANGNLWVGTRHSGAFSVDVYTNHVEQFTIDEGLPGNEVTCILNDKKGYVWMVTRGGLVRYDAVRKEMIKFDEHNGLRSTQFYYNSCLYTDDQLFLGHNLGIEELNLDGFELPTEKPLIGIAALQINDQIQKNVDTRLPLLLDRNRNKVRIQLFLADYVSPLENQFLYKLSEDEDWKVVEKDHVVSFSSLPPGTHQLSIKGANHQGIWSEPLVYTLDVESFNWVLAGGLSLFGLLLISGLGSAYLFRVRYLRRIKELEEENLTLKGESALSVHRTKAEIARDLHDDLGADLSRLVLSLENRLQREDLSDFSLAWTRECWEYAQRVTREVRFLSWSVDPERNWLPDLVDRIYREAHDTFVADSIQFKTSKIPNIHLVPTIRKDIFLIFRETLTNILHHASAQKVSIRINYKKDIFEIIVEDDGKGFDVENVVEGNGLSNMRRRAKNLNGTLLWESTPEQGTRVVFQTLIERT